MDKLNYAEFRSLISHLKESDYEFTSFSKVKFGQRDSFDRKVILRHDIDQSLEKAVEMAEIENELGVSSIYFLFLRTPFYNIFSQRGESLIRRLIQLNHYIGLHFDYSSFRHVSPTTVTFNILQEIHFIESFFQIKLDSVSFHRPFSLEFFEKLELGIYPHAYESLFVKNFYYCSDSRGTWRYGYPLDSEAFEKGRPMQILIHPIWWQKDFISPIDSLSRWKKVLIKNYENSVYNELKGFWTSNTEHSPKDL